jgi:mannose-6-phosphate isomerase
VVDKVVKPWGYELLIADKEDCGAKLLFVRPGHRTSLQVHSQRHETWYVLSGTGWAQIGENMELISTGDVVEISTGCKHRLEGVTGILLIEVVPQYVPGDIERIEDDYVRV